MEADRERRLSEVSALLRDRAGLDPASAQGVEQCVSQWFQQAPQQRTIVWVSHDQEQAARMADRRLVMAAGRIVQGA